MSNPCILVSSQKLQIYYCFKTPSEIFSSKCVRSFVHQRHINRIDLFAGYPLAALGRILMESDQQVCLFQITQIVFCSVLRFEAECFLQTFVNHNSRCRIQKMVRHLLKSRRMDYLESLFNVAFKDIIDQSLYVVAVISYRLNFRESTLTHIVIKGCTTCGYCFCRS